MKAVFDILENANAHTFVTGPNYAKGIFAKNRHVEVRYIAGTDLFNVYAFTLSRGTKICKEKRFEGVFVSDLKRIITQLAK